MMGRYRLYPSVPSLIRDVSVLMNERPRNVFLQNGGQRVGSAEGNSTPLDLVSVGTDDTELKD